MWAKKRYLFYWYLMQDGRIEFEIKLSGELSTNLLSEGESKPLHGTLVAPGVNAQLHQVGNGGGGASSAADLLLFLRVFTSE